MRPLLDRARDFSLASLFVAYPDDDLEALASNDGLLGDDPAPFAPVRRAAAGGLDALRASWIERFEIGSRRASLYETEYGRMRGLAKGNDLADLAGFYKAFGLDLDGTAHELHDFLPVELEFVAVLLAKEHLLATRGDGEGVSVVSGARRAFLAAHLGPFAPAVAGLVADDPTYGPVFSWVAGLVAEECSALGVHPTALEVIADDEARRDLRCGSLPVVP